MISYAITITKGIKWYRRLGMQLLLGISVVNASMAYRIATRTITRQLLAAESPRLPENATIFAFDGVSIITLFGKIIPGEAFRKKQRHRMDRTKAQKNLKKTSTYCSNCSSGVRNAVYFVELG